MEKYLAIALAITGMILVIIEMTTMTFYLLALAVDCFATAALVYLFGPGLLATAVAFALIAALLLPLAHYYRQRLQKHTATELDDMDKGGAATITDVGPGMLKVRYRDSIWEAEWEGTGQPMVGSQAIIKGRTGAKLRIRSTH